MRIAIGKSQNRREIGRAFAVDQNLGGRGILRVQPVCSNGLRNA